MGGGERREIEHKAHLEEGYQESEEQCDPSAIGLERGFVWKAISAHTLCFEGCHKAAENSCNMSISGTPPTHLRVPLTCASTECTLEVIRTISILSTLSRSRRPLTPSGISKGGKAELALASRNDVGE